VYSLSFRRIRRMSSKSAFDCMRNGNKSPKIPYSAMVREVEKDPESVSGDRIPTKS